MGNLPQLLVAEEVIVRQLRPGRESGEPQAQKTGPKAATCLNPIPPTYIPYCSVKENTCTSPPPAPDADPRYSQQPPEWRIKMEMAGFINQARETSYRFRGENTKPRGRQRKAIES